MRSPLLIALLALTLTQSALAFSLQDPEKDYWKSSGLKIDDFIESEVPHCNDDGLHILGCVEALNVIAASMKPSAVFATATEASTEKFLGPIITWFSGGLNLYQFKKVPTQPKADFLTEVKEQKESRARHSKLIQDLSKSKSKINFDQLFKEAKALILQSDLRAHEAATASELFNTNLAIVKDPHSRLWSQEEMNEMRAGKGESFAGIGTMIKPVNGKFTVIQNIKGGAAVKAGLLIGDVIVKIDGVLVKGKDINEMVKMLRGVEGTRVTLNLLRKNAAFNIEITRSKIEVQNVESFVVNDNGISYGYILLQSFMDDDAIQKIYTAHIKLATENDIQGLILDLRRNGGGLLSNAVTLGGIFVGKKKVVGQKDLKTNSMAWWTPSFDALLPNIPLVVLIDGGSASASEIVAGALQDYGRAWLVGDRTYGKATIQGLDSEYPLSQKRPGVIFMSTIARFYQPTGRTNQLVGIIPDFAVDPMPNATEMDKYSPHEDDNYTALPLLGKPWVQPRAAEVAKINQCRAERAKAHVAADDHYQALTADGRFAPDYRLLVAQDVLICSGK